MEKENGTEIWDAKSVSSFVCFAEDDKILLYAKIQISTNKT